MGFKADVRCEVGLLGVIRSDKAWLISQPQFITRFYSQKTLSGDLSHKVHEAHKP